MFAVLSRTLGGKEEAVGEAKSSCSSSSCTECMVPAPVSPAEGDAVLPKGLGKLFSELLECRWPRRNSALWLARRRAKKSLQNCKTSLGCSLAIWRSKLRISLTYPEGSDIGVV